MAATTRRRLNNTLKINQKSIMPTPIVGDIIW